MGFRLRITKGKTEGKEFSFTKDRVTVGRNHDNDLVIYDLNISRTHFEIAAVGAYYQVRDMGSRNGTKVNASPMIEGALKDGDRIQAGGIEFEFLFSDTQPRVKLDGERGEVNAPHSETQRAMLEQIQTYALNLRDLQAQADKQGVALPVHKSRAEADKRSIHKPKPETAKPAAPDPQQAKVVTSSSVQPLSTQRVPNALLRKLMRSKLFYPAVGLLAFVAFFGTFWLLYQRPVTDRSHLVFDITARTDARAFGTGKVDVGTAKRATFSFTAIGGRTVLRFTPGGVENPGELQLLLNGQAYQNLATTGSGWGKPTEIKLDRKMLKAGEINTIAFVYNEALGNGRWGVRELSLHQDPIPAPSAERAKELLRLATDAFEHKRVAPQNLASAEENFKRALLLLEGFEQQPAEYAVAENGYKAARDELAVILESGLFRVERAQRYGKNDEAEATLRELMLYLPDERDPRREELATLLSQLKK